MVSLSATIFAQALGISSLTMTVASEILPENFREFGVSFCTTVLGACAFIALKYSPVLCTVIGLHGTLFLFGGFCLLCAFFIIFYLPETKGKTYAEIMESMK